MERGWLHGPREAARVAALRRLEALERPIDPDLHAIAELAAHLSGSAHAAVHLVEGGRLREAVLLGGGPGMAEAVAAHAEVVLIRDEPVWEPDGGAAGAPVGPPVAGLGGTPLRTAGGAVLGVLSVAHDRPLELGEPQRWGLEVLAGQVVALLELRGHARALAAARRRFSLAFAQAPVGMALVDGDACWTEANPALLRMLGVPAAELLGAPVEEVVYEEDVPALLDVLEGARRAGEEPGRLEVRLLGPDGELVWAAVSVACPGEDGGGELVLHLDDITARKAADAELVRRATHDPLTGLPNRLLLADRLATALERLRRGQGEVTLMVVDLDGFKDINDQHGHDAGDRLLVVLAERLRASLRTTDTVVRYGGDEFVVLCEERTQTGEGARIAGRLVDVVSRPVAIDVGTAHVRVAVGASIGVASTTEHQDAGALLRRADAALYAAKSAGRGRVVTG